MWTLWVIPLLVSYCLAACSSERLPLPGSYADGKFDYPDGTAQCFTQGSSMNVSWETKYSTSNLWLIHGDNYNNPTGLALNTGTNWYEWKVDYNTNNHSMPFSFRVVDTQGTSKEQAQGGFVSGQFYVSFNSASSTATTTSTSSATNTGTSTREPTTSPTTTDSTRSASSGRSSHGTTLGLGLGVGLGVAACIAGAVAFFFFHRKNSPSSSQFSSVPNKEPSEQPTEQQPIYEAGGQSTQELSGDNSWNSGAGHGTNQRFEMA
ncbi:hypothetical protein ASPWEDRAFT_30521 [Aspergillus wentii DTO 134E9]|uniref:Mid2 domain-containing protein n=1 Tax=Aspergillus wentii DTO 134E9 TaxID=1073089 RepID=A0A1L9REU6_ASPWE|nr:uncharacterized protein ASPWEDRAFT_30521 [Aspergillus wentii DTO 134E9]OJJ33445.1 hypothetical protein ASPWEDRAFT_30521 [Aspergillus wentii DTO 134E9]